MVSVFCVLCCATLEKAAERRNLFSESSQSVVPLLLKTVTCIYGKDVFRKVFKSDCKVCRPCFRRLDRITKLDKELQEKQVELSQQVKRLGDRVLGTEFVHNTASVEPEVAVNTPTRKRQQSTVLKSPSPTKRARLQKLTPVRNIMGSMLPKGDPKNPSPAVAVSLMSICRPIVNSHFDVSL